MKKIALVGCGRISHRHIEAIQSNSGIKICCVCDIKEEKARNTGQKLNVPYFTDYKLIKDADVIAVLTPSGLHPRHAADIA
ncbi:MAG TPA: Gfo/Idh/MocA family oxidoreductase, partial [Spirochaetota bacterium]|nr:Gfo/Idh/MocA family oxidoreductase [Spirochaetota bacterium]